MKLCSNRIKLSFFLFCTVLLLGTGCAEVDTSFFREEPLHTCAISATCSSGICFQGFVTAPSPRAYKPNSCIEEYDVKYVSLDTCGPGKDTDHKGTRKDPFCQVTTAVSKGMFVSVKPTQNANGYDGVVLQKGQVALIAGTSRTNAPLIRGVSVQDAGTEAYLDGLLLSTKTDLASTPGGTGASCRSSATLNLFNSVVSGNTQGVAASQCQHLQLEKSYVGNNANVGLSLGNGSNYRIANSLIVQNGGIGVVFGSASGEFLFNTVSQNGIDTRIADARQGGALNCLPEADPSGMHPVSIQNSILVGNQTNVGSSMPTQIQGPSCELKNVVVSVRDALPSIRPTSQGVSKSEVVFDKKGTEWTLNLMATTWDSSLVMDRAQVDSTAGIRDDYFGNPRPRADNLRKPGGSGFDIGHEQIIP